MKSPGVGALAHYTPSYSNGLLETSGKQYTLQTAGTKELDYQSYPDLERQECPFHTQ